MGTNYYVVPKKPTISNALHIGKSSAGWRFLFQEVNPGMYDFDYDLEIHSYEDWVNFLKDNDDILILNEYDEVVSVDELLKVIEDKQKIDNICNFKYCENVNGYRFTSDDFA